MIVLTCVSDEDCVVVTNPTGCIHLGTTEVQKLSEHVVEKETRAAIRKLYAKVVDEMVLSGDLPESFRNHTMPEMRAPGQESLPLQNGY